MVQFRLKNPTEIRFGKGEIAAGTRVRLFYGGGSTEAAGRAPFPRERRVISKA